MPVSKYVAELKKLEMCVGKSCPLMATARKDGQARHDYDDAPEYSGLGAPPANPVVETQTNLCGLLRSLQLFSFS